MVYVGRDGTIHQEQPWGMDKILGIFSGIINLIFAFFQTMLPIDNSSTRDNFRGSSGRRGGGGGGGGWYPRPPGGGPRPGSNIHGLGSTPPDPPPACGSCCGR
ncbi:glycine-rich selenoprotein isoform X2 [Halyomorpha halys]|uniref:glycine-rich selenoprotein isoform X2 n=1 Tax=Halyomorpha halys TaxID=286706 RepID=UPI0006D527B7|nr:glycine-rich selenoprotein isoform X2 [Halyomorpha halys]